MLSPRPRALELVLPDGVGFGHPLFYIILGFLVISAPMSRLVGVPPGRIINR